MSAPAPDEFLRGPKWRTRTTATRRHRAAALTFVLIVGFGLAVMWTILWTLQRLGAPAWIVTLTWAIPTACVLLWALIRPSPAELTDDDDDSWFGYTLRWALVGEVEPRATPLRILAALVFGAPVGWALILVALLTVVGII